MNVERKDSGDGDIQYCCCDAAESTCMQLDDDNFLWNDNCESLCDIFFTMNVSQCSGNSQGCLTLKTMKSAITMDSPSKIAILYNFTFMLNSIPNQVSYM